MRDRKNESLVSALSWAGLTELPPKDTKENVYVRALALVAKTDGTESYVALVKDRTGEDKIVTDFGSIYPIAKVKEVYPYNFLDARFIPSDILNNKEDMIAWLKVNAKHTSPEEIEKMAKNKLKKMVIAIASARQIESEKD